MLPVGDRKLRALDLSMGWAGPLLGQMLAEMGIEVIKIEDTRHFDWWRGSLSMGPREMQVIERSAVFNTVNRGKLGVTLDLSDARGLALVKRLAADADILIENYSPGVMQRFGLGYPALSAINPRLIMISMPSFGSEGPECEARGYGNTVEAMAGITGLTGYHDAPQPYTLSNALGDPIGGLSGTFAVLVALREREETGKSQLIELAQVEAAIPFVSGALLDFQLTAESPVRRGNRHPEHVPHGIYRCAGGDHWIAISVIGEEQWRGLCRTLDLQHLANDPRFTDHKLRKRNEDALDALLAERIAAFDNAEQLSRKLAAANVCAGQVSSAPEVMADPQIQARDFFVPIDRAVVGTHLYPGAVARFSATPVCVDRPAPLLGEHNRKVFGEVLGMSEREIDALEREGVIGREPRD